MKFCLEKYHDIKIKYDNKNEPNSGEPTEDLRRAKTAPVDEIFDQENSANPILKSKLITN
jgi:hypothetical protein